MKFAKKLFMANLLAAAFVTGLSASGAAQNVAGTNGGGEKAHLGIPIAKVGGTNGGGDDRSQSFAPVSQWCTDQGSVLDEMKTQFLLKIQNNNKQEALDVWKDGLTAALLNSPQSEFSLTYRVLSRGLDMFDQVSAKISSDPTWQETMIHIANHYIDLVHKTIDVDHQFYLSYRYLYEKCDQDCPQEQFDKNKYEDVFAQYAKAELDWVVSKELVTVDTSNSSLPNAGVLPRWSPDAWLQLVQIVTGEVADDLQTSPWADDYSCLITKLLATRNAVRDQSWGGFRDTSNIVYPRITKYAQILADHNHLCVDQVPK